MRWPPIRAGLVAAAIGFGLIDGCPLPDKPQAWQEGLVAAVRPIRDTLERPVGWLRQTLRISQQWSLFQAAPRDRYRMWIEGKLADGAWRTIYRAGDPVYDEDVDLLRYRRIRDAWNPSDEPAQLYGEFCAWMTGRVLARHAELVAARVRMERVELDNGGFVPSGQFVLAFVRAR